MSLSPAYRSAIEDFHRMRRRAGVQKIFNIFKRRSSLLSYENVRRQLHAIERSGVDLESIPISAIQGSVGRYTDFTRDFLPTQSVDRQRWARVKAQISTQEGVPPIDVYQLGEVYFVADGNHRVSVAKEMGSSSIDAYVRKVTAKVPLALDEDLDQLLIKAEFVEFLEQTEFQQLYPDVDLKVTAPGRYTFILQQIEALHFSRELESGKTLPYSDGVKHWYDTVYYPIIESIREQDILSAYPERTETDLFLWIFKHRAALVETLGWDIPPDDAAKYFARQSSSKLERYYEQTKRIFRRIIRFASITSGPSPGTWRKEKMAVPEGRLFANILVVIDGTDQGWEVLSQGTAIAGLEGSNLFGLHIAKTNQPISKKNKEAIRAEFSQRCESCNTLGQLAFELGSPNAIIRERADWTDLAILSAGGKYKTDLQAIIQTCPSPLLITKGEKFKYNSILLAYNGSPKSEEALFLAAYLSTFWELSLVVITFIEKNHKHITFETMMHAKDFLDYYGIDAQFFEATDKPANSILNAANAHHIDLIVMGGYSDHIKNRSKKHVLDEVLGNSSQAIMICR